MFVAAAVCAAAQRAVLAKPTQEERRTAAAMEAGPWRVNARLHISWRATGSLAYVLNGPLGVEQEDLKRDWESTFYPDVPNVVEVNPDKKFGDDTYWRSTSHFDKGFDRYARPGDTLQDRIVAYLADCGVTSAEIKAVRDILLEREPAKAQ